MRNRDLLAQNLGLRTTLAFIASYDSPVSTVAKDALKTEIGGVGPLAVADVMFERVRQISREGFTIEHDNQLDPGELAGAGASYAFNAGCLLHPEVQSPAYIGRTPEMWVLPPEMWKPAQDVEGARRDLVKAAALILAEIERLDREANRAAEAG